MRGNQPTNDQKTFFINCKPLYFSKIFSFTIEEKKAKESLKSSMIEKQVGMRKNSFLVRREKMLSIVFHYST